jgi:hypothetical protein
MIYEADGLLELVAHFAARKCVPVPVGAATMLAIVDEAQRLSAGRTADEPAALFFECARRAHLFGKVATSFLDVVGALQADAVGLQLDATELDLMLLRGRIAYGAQWPEVRAAFAEWVRAPAEPNKRRPPKRPR